MRNKTTDMIKLQKGFIALTIGAMALFSCGDKEKKTSPEAPEQTKHADPDQKEANYDPGAGWELAWSDEFDRDTIDTTTWNFQVVEAGRFNDEWQRYTNSHQNAYIQDGSLVIRAMHESEVHGMDQYTSARLNTANKYTWKYGKIAARIRLPKGEGVWPAFWMLGANIDENGGDTPWPQCGEIDILELYGSRDDGVVEGNAHYADTTGAHAMMGAVAYKLDRGKFADAFHVFALEWSPERLTWFVDGTPYASMDISSDAFSEFRKDFFILLNIAVGGRHAGRPDATTQFPQHMYVDWVRVYTN